MGGLRVNPIYIYIHTYMYGRANPFKPERGTA